MHNFWRSVAQRRPLQCRFLGFAKFLLQHFSRICNADVALSAQRRVQSTVTGKSLYEKNVQWHQKFYKVIVRSASPGVCGTKSAAFATTFLAVETKTDLDARFGRHCQILTKLLLDFALKTCWWHKVAAISVIDYPV